MIGGRAHGAEAASFSVLCGAGSPEAVGDVPEDDTGVRNFPRRVLEIGAWGWKQAANGIFRLRRRSFRAPRRGLLHCRVGMEASPQGFNTNKASASLTKQVPPIPNRWSPYPNC